MRSRTELPAPPGNSDLLSGVLPFKLLPKPAGRWARFCRLTWLEDTLAVPHWAPEGDISLALRAREL
jgi:hypothetical protein